VQYYGIYTDKAVHGKISTKTIWLGRDYTYNVRQLFALVKGHYKTFCIEDVMDAPDPALDVVLQQFFESYFPKRAPWEKREQVAMQPLLDGYTGG